MSILKFSTAPEGVEYAEYISTDVCPGYSTKPSNDKDPVL